VRVRRFRCLHPECPRKIFAERLPCAQPYARRTQRQAARLREVAFVAGCRAGERLVKWLGMGVSHDTLLRLLRHSQIAPVATPRLLGVDDFAFRRGQRYGTILVDLETHRVIDLLPDRSGASFLAWLLAHPGVVVVSRDRASAYAEAATQGAPQAQQVADRYHLVANLRETVQHLLEQKRSCLPRLELDGSKGTSAASAHDPLPAAPGTSPSLPPAGLLHDPAALAVAVRQNVRERLLQVNLGSTAAVHRQASRTNRLERFAHIHALAQQGFSKSAIVRAVGVCRATVDRFLRAETFPEQGPRPRGYEGSKLDPFVPLLLQHWQAGTHRGKELYRLLVEHGYTGSRALVALFIAGLRRVLAQADDPCGTTRPQGTSERPPRRLFSKRQRLAPRQASFLFIKRPETLTDRQGKRVEQVCQAHPDLRHAYELAQAFVTMLADRAATRLDGWLEQAQGSHLPELRGFAEGLRRDYAAVQAACTTEVSNGITEGQVHRLKLLKRLGYGHASFELLRLQVLHNSGPTKQQNGV